MATKLAEFEVYRCPTHGLVEATTWSGWDGADEAGDIPECPVSMGLEGVCHDPLDGPYKATVEVGGEA